MSAAAKPRRRRRPPEETRRLILDAGIACLKEAPYRELSVDVVMSRTGLTRTLFYRHFDGIPALVLALIAETAAELLEVAQAWAHSDEVGPDEARRRLAAFVDFHTRNAPLVRAIVEASHHDAAVEAAYQAMVETFVDITQRAIAERVGPGDPELDAEEVARALVRMLDGYLIDPRRTQDPGRALDAVATVWTRTLFGGGSAG